MTEFLTMGPDDPAAHMVLSHGAGAPMTSPFMETMTCLLAERGVKVTRFEFDYMAARRRGQRKPPPKAELLVSEYEAVVGLLRRKPSPNQKLFIAGKSLGGRVASLVADRLFEQELIAGLVCLGYPFHPPGKPEKLRTAHLASLACPALILQGERDPFGVPEEVGSYALSPAIRVHWLPDGDHDFKPRRSSGISTGENLSSAADQVLQFVKSRASFKERA